jgi:hypothetical protein
MKVTFEKLEAAFIQEEITLEQFIEVLVDNFGAKKTRKIIRRNLELALAKETAKERLPEDQHPLSDLHPPRH